MAVLGLGYWINFSSRDDLILPSATVFRVFLLLQTAGTKLMDLPHTGLAMMPIWGSFRFTTADKEKEFQTTFLKQRPIIIQHILVVAEHVVAICIGSVKTEFRVVMPVCITPLISTMFLFLLAKSWVQVSRHISHVNSAICLAAVTGLSVSTCLRTQHYSAMYGTDSLSQVEAQEAVWVYLGLCLLQILILGTGVCFHMILVLLHIATFGAFCLTLALSPVTVSLHAPMTFFVFGLFALLWRSIDHTVSVRRLFVTERQREIERNLKFEAEEQASRIINHNLKNVMSDVLGLIDIVRECSLPESATVHLLLALDRLRSGINWCRKRTVTRALIRDQYQPAPKPVDLQDFVGVLVQGRHLQVSPFQNMTVSFDELSTSIILENAITNAIRHALPGSPDVRFSIETPQAPHGASQDDPHLLFKITNRADPTKPVVTQDFLDQILQGDRENVVSGESVSEGLGLQHIFRAARKIGIEPSLTQAGDIVSFALATKVLRSDLQAADAWPIQEIQESLPEVQHWKTNDRDRLHDSVPNDASAFPRNLTFCCLDDEKVTRIILSSQIRRFFPGAVVHEFGDTPAEVEQFLQTVVREEPNVVILDENLDYKGHVEVRGSALVAQLKYKYSGLLCIRSGNCEQADLDLYYNSGAHCVLDKAEAPEATMSLLKRSYLKHAENRRQMWGQRRPSQFSGSGEIDRAPAGPHARPSPSFLSEASYIAPSHLYPCTSPANCAPVVFDDV